MRPSKKHLYKNTGGGLYNDFLKFQAKDIEFNHLYPEGEEESHIANICCECMPYSDPENIYNIIHMNL